MHQLKKASGRGFDTTFLTMMIKHHQGAIDMARTEQQHGAYGPARKMAVNVRWGQHRGAAPSGGCISQRAG